MPKSLPHDVELGALMNVMGGEGVPQRKGRGARDPGFGQVFADEGVDGA